MWGSVLVLAGMNVLNPVRLGLLLLVISRPRTVQNLLAYWVGGLIVSVPNMMVPLMVLHFTPWFGSFAHDLATPATEVSSTVRHIQIGMGVLTMLIAALMTVRLLTRQRAHLLTSGANTSTLVPGPMGRLLSRPHDEATEGRSPIRRLVGRVHNAWDNGSLWVAVVLGVGSAPGFEENLFVLAIILASGAAIGTQVSAAIAFIVGTLAIVEIILASYLATPAKTQAMVQLLHDWAQAHRRKILIAMFAVLGVTLAAQGVGGV